MHDLMTIDEMNEDIFFQKLQELEERGKEDLFKTSLAIRAGMLASRDLISIRPVHILILGQSEKGRCYIC